MGWGELIAAIVTIVISVGGATWILRDTLSKQADKFAEALDEHRKEYAKEIKELREEFKSELKEIEKTYEHKRARMFNRIDDIKKHTSEHYALKEACHLKHNFFDKIMDEVKKSIDDLRTDLQTLTKTVSEAMIKREDN